MASRPRTRVVGVPTTRPFDCITTLTLTGREPISWVATGLGDDTFLIEDSEGYFGVAGKLADVLGLANGLIMTVEAIMRGDGTVISAEASERVASRNSGTATRSPKPNGTTKQATARS